jgi:hypothetical protein
VVPGAAILRLLILPLPGTARVPAPLLDLERHGADGDLGDRRAGMGLFDRLRGRRTVGGNARDRRRTLDRSAGRADLAHLEQFVATRRGVEGYVEPRTAVTETTILLVAADGEWTRRRIDGPDTARRLSRELAVPVYDAQVTGYPQRMRDWSRDHRPPTTR